MGTNGFPIKVNYYPGFPKTQNAQTLNIAYREPGYKTDPDKSNNINNFNFAQWTNLNSS